MSPPTVAPRSPAVASVPAKCTRPRPDRATVRRTSSSPSTSRPSLTRRSRTVPLAGRSIAASTRASSRPERMTSALERPPRRRPSASTMMLLPAPVSPVTTVSPGPSASSSSSMSANPEMRSSVITCLSSRPSSTPRKARCANQATATCRSQPKRLESPDPVSPTALALPLAPGQLVVENREERPGATIDAQRALGLPNLD